MTHELSTTRLVLTSLLVAFGTAFILARYARSIICSWCRKGYAIHPRGELELCGSCSRVYDDNRKPARRRRALPWRLWRSPR